MHWRLQLIHMIGGWSGAFRLVLLLFFLFLLFALGRVLIDRFRYHILYGLGGLLVLYWIVSAIR